ncbi:hypothetical protein C8F04DRAFT_1102156 [Mycena alexandri]|uniref:Uncharacterized protein n=1 Tax=Mycena alexandri TaxID=1745969 RepID=A0AAD6SUG7_9AGAR|nr:hypothetical protein C8F04DRAFT_1102156 [Mycena alexandri]
MYSEDYEDDPDYLAFAQQQDRYTGNNSEDDDGVSEYNDGAGVKYIIKFKPQLPPLQPNEKRRSNAKADTVNCSAFVHEKAPMSDFLDAIILAIGRDEQTMKFKIVSETLRTTRFKATWTISRTDYQNMQLSSEAGYKELVEQAVKKAKVEAKLEIVECELEPRALTALNGDETAADGDGPDKSKKRKLNPEEEKMAETVVELQHANRCSDRGCSSRFCFIGNPGAKHVRLTPVLLNIWAAGIIAKIPTVTTKKPPPPEEEKAFWPLDDGLSDIDDISMLATRRRNIAAKPATSSGVTINNDFSALATIMQPIISASTSVINRQNPSEAPSTPNNNHLPHRLLASPAKPAEMTIPQFCNAFRLSADILQRLSALELEGPHLLAYVENSVLDAHLTIGQRAAVRFAENEWKKGKIGR